MRKSYIAQSAFTLNEVSIRPGDILIHDQNNANKLTVYRNKAIVKITTHSALGMLTMLKNNWVSQYEEPTAPPTPVKPVETAPNVAVEPPKTEPTPHYDTFMKNEVPQRMTRAQRKKALEAK